MREMPDRAASAVALILVALLAVCSLRDASPVAALQSTGQTVPGQGDLANVSREVEWSGQRYLFDRMVNISVGRAGLVTIGRTDNLRLYAANDQGPFDRLYGLARPRPESGLARYLPETPINGGQCPAEAAQISTLTVENSTYAFAGFEPDLTSDRLNQVGQANDQPLFAESQSAPFAEVFVQAPEGLQRFVLVNEQGVPVQLTNPVPFGGQQLTFVEDATGQVDTGSLSRTGCAADFALAATAGSQPPFTEVFAIVGGHVLRYAATGEAGSPVPSEEASPSGPVIVPVGTEQVETETPTLAATETSTLAPTETETAVPTETETAVPTETATEVPTETATVAPTETATIVPTETATEVPTETETLIPTETATVAPTETETVAPTETATQIPTDTATVAPTETSTPAPAATESPTVTVMATGAPTQSAPQTSTVTIAATASPTAIPTSVNVQVTVIAGPEIPPTSVPPAPCPGDVGPLGPNGVPAQLPPTIQIGNQTFAFTGVADPAHEGKLTRVGCAGPYQVVTSAASVKETVRFLFLATPPQSGAPVLFRYEAVPSYHVQFQVSGSAQVITNADQQYIAGDPWSRVIFGSLDVILYAADPTQPSPPRLFARSVSSGVIGEYVLEQEGTNATAITPQAGSGLNPDLFLGQDHYLLTATWTVVGSTADGWVTLYAATSEGVPDTLLGVDPRITDLLVYRRSGT